MNDITREQHLRLSQVAREEGKHVSTIHRWRMRGINGIKLQCYKRGGDYVTSREALRRFFKALTVAAGGAMDNDPLRDRQVEASHRALTSH